MLPLNGPFRPDCIAAPISAECSGKHPTTTLIGSIRRGNTITQRRRSMPDDNRARGWLCAVASAALLAVAAAVAPPASAQDTRPQVSSDAAKKVDLSSAPAVPAVARPADLVTNRPTIPM